jgi:hypothetical protein
MVLIERSPWLCSEEVELFAPVVLDAIVFSSSKFDRSHPVDALTRRSVYLESPVHRRVVAAVCPFSDS